VCYSLWCNTQSSAPEDGRNCHPKHVELIGIINKLLSFHLIGCLYYLFLNSNHMESVCFVLFSEQTANSAFHIIKSFGFIREVESVYCAVRKYLLI